VVEGEREERPTTLLDVLAPVSPLLAALIAIGGVIGTIIFTNRWERDRQEQERLLAQDRQEHERLLKQTELDSAHSTRLRDERIAAYRRLLAATTTAQTRERRGTLRGVPEISLLAGPFL
jgi:hypothetical protein